MELVRLAQGSFMAWDKKMFLLRQPAPHAASSEVAQKIPMKANNTNLNEDLGAIDYILYVPLLPLFFNFNSRFA